MAEKEDLFKQFLISHTKDKLKEKASDSIYSAIKNYLLSHIYGCVVFMSLIATVAVCALSGQNVNTDAVAVSAVPAEVQTAWQTGETSLPDSGGQHQQRRQLRKQTKPCCFPKMKQGVPLSVLAALALQHMLRQRARR